jgi:MFS family permease
MAPPNIKDERSTDESSAPVEHASRLWTGAAALRTDAFSALHNPNYRRYFYGQTVSLTGTWMQTVAQSWLVLQITGSGTQVGLVVAAQTLPVLFISPYAGLVADRRDKRTMMIVIQAIMAVLALVLGLLTVTHEVRLWQVYVLAACLGANTAFDGPTRQSFVLEMVGPEDLRNAVSLNGVLLNSARMIGPGIAGLIIATGGTGMCFLLNSASFIAVIASLLRLDTATMTRAAPTKRAPGQLLEGWRYVRSSPILGITLAMGAVIGCFAYNFQVVLPVLAHATFHCGAEVYGLMTASMAMGAVVGGLVMAARGRTGLRAMVVSAALFAVGFLAAAVAPNLDTELAALVLLGATGVTVIAQGNSTLQLSSRPDMSGRVMSFWTVAFVGSTPIGGPIAGAVSQHFGGRSGLFLGCTACLASAALGALALRRRRSPHSSA